MKSNIPMPVVVIAIVVLVALAGLMVYKGASRANSGDIKSMTSSINQGKPQTPALSTQEAAGDAVLRGGK